MNAGSKLFLCVCVCVCRSNGYVYTYRLHKDDAGSWAAEVRLFIYLNLFFPPFALIVRWLFSHPKNPYRINCTPSSLWSVLISSRGCSGASLIQQAVNLRQTWVFFQERRHWEMAAFLSPLAITPCEIVPRPTTPHHLKFKTPQHQHILQRWEM